MNIQSEVTIQNNKIFVRRVGQSERQTALILGRESKNGTEYIYADRLIHESHEKQLGDYEVSGAISSILSVKI